MVILINKIILILSFGGICAILIRKIPILLELPKETTKEKEEVFIIKKIGKKIVEKIKNFSWRKILEKFLWKLKIYILKIENFISILLKRLKKENKKEKEQLEEDDYWDKIKK